MTQKEKDYSDYINNLRLRHFKGAEFVFQSRRKNAGGRCGIPPKSMWKNMVPTIQIVDMLRAHFGSSISLNSTYRSPGYNKACGGKSSSYHMQFMALDISSNRVSPTRIYNKLLQWRSAGLFKGGLSRYPSFVHIDTRGYNANW